MKEIKKFLLMFLASLVTFLLFAAIDDYKAVIVPFLKGGSSGKMGGFSPGATEEVKDFIQGFNTILSQIYLSSDPSMTLELPASDQVRKTVAEDLGFLTKNGKVMDIRVNDIQIEKTERVSPLVIRVKTKEVVSLSYLDIKNRTPIAPSQAAEYQVIYSIEMMRGELIVVGLEALGMKILET